MKQIVILTIILLAGTGLSALAEEKQVAAKPALTLQKVHRNFALEKNVFIRTKRLHSFLQPGVKKRLNPISHKLLDHLVKDAESTDLYLLVRKEVHKNFPRISNKQSDLLTFYVLGEAARILADENELRKRLDGMNEMSEMTSLRLQMTMDRRSKFISTLSQMMKKISTTQDTLVQNIK